jgi:cyclopropane fatty-acyl-phospholipid synthase-like methyltransferase
MEKQNISCKITDKGNSCCNTDVGTNDHSEKHWQHIYEDADIKKLGWYENESTPSLQLIEKCNVTKKAMILNVGAGASTLIDSLIEKNYTNLIVNDISNSALEKIKKRVSNIKQDVQWIVDDLVNSSELKSIPQVDIWNDRAVLHFFIDKKDQDAYFKLVNKKVKKNGFVILAVFNLQGAKMCSGLPVKRYSVEMLQEKLGDTYVLKDSFNYLYTMPNGDDRSYIYTLFQRK